MAVMTPPGAWVIASSNLGKISEFKSLFEPFKVDLIAQADLGIKEVPEPHPSFVENALVKAREASRLASLPALSDDSGICIEQLQDRPGVHSARWSLIHGGSAGDAMNNELVKQQLHGKSSRAYFFCVLAFLRWPDDPVPVLAQASWQGLWLPEGRGSAGFGYDPHFLPDGQEETAAEMSPSLKNRLSHRAMATAALVEQLLRLGRLSAPAK